MTKALAELSADNRAVLIGRSRVMIQNSARVNHKSNLKETAPNVSGLFARAAQILRKGDARETPRRGDVREAVERVSGVGVVGFGGCWLAAGRC